MLGDLGELIVARGFKKLPKVQKIARSGHTGWQPECTTCWCLSEGSAALVIQERDKICTGWSLAQVLTSMDNLMNHF